MIDTTQVSIAKPTNGNAYLLVGLPYFDYVQSKRLAFENLANHNLNRHIHGGKKVNAYAKDIMGYLIAIANIRLEKLLNTIEGEESYSEAFKDKRGLYLPIYRIQIANKLGIDPSTVTAHIRKSLSNNFDFIEFENTNRDHSNVGTDGRGFYRIWIKWKHLVIAHPDLAVNHSDQNSLDSAPSASIDNQVVRNEKTENSNQSYLGRKEILKKNRKKHSSGGVPPSFSQLPVGNKNLEMVTDTQLINSSKKTETFFEVAKKSLKENGKSTSTSNNFSQVKNRIGPSSAKPNSIPSSNYTRIHRPCGERETLAFTLWTMAANSIFADGFKKRRLTPEDHEDGIRAMFDWLERERRDKEPIRVTAFRIKKAIRLQHKNIIDGFEIFYHPASYFSLLKKDGKYVLHAGTFRFMMDFVLPKVEKNRASNYNRKKRIARLNGCFSKMDNMLLKLEQFYANKPELYQKDLDKKVTNYTLAMMKYFMKWDIVEEDRELILNEFSAEISAYYSPERLENYKNWIQTLLTA